MESQEREDIGKCKEGNRVGSFQKISQYIFLIFYEINRFLNLVNLENLVELSFFLKIQEI